MDDRLRLLEPAGRLPRRHPAHSRPFRPWDGAGLLSCPADLLSIKIQCITSFLPSMRRLTALLLPQTPTFLLPQFQAAGSPQKTATSAVSPSKRSAEKRFSFSSSLRRYSPSASSPSKQGQAALTSPARLSQSLAESGGPGSPVLPFSQRQSKSRVAAREILKKTESVSASIPFFCLSL